MPRLRFSLLLLFFNLKEILLLYQALLNIYVHDYTAIMKMNIINFTIEKITIMKKMKQKNNNNN